MDSGSNITGTLNELTEFVNDRIEGYQTAATDTKDAQRKAYYQELAGQSQQFAEELNGFANTYGGKAEEGTTLKGKLYRGWMDVKSTFTGKDEQAILNANVYGEEWALKAYKDALDSGDLPQPVRQAVERQYQASQQTYARLKSMGGESHP